MKGSILKLEIFLVILVLLFSTVGINADNEQSSTEEPSDKIGSIKGSRNNLIAETISFSINEEGVTEEIQDAAISENTNIEDENDVVWDSKFNSHFVGVVDSSDDEGERFIPEGCTNYDTLYPPWDSWDSDRWPNGEGLYSEEGYETGTLYDVFAHAITAAYLPFGVITVTQDVWNDELWTCPESNNYIFTFDYNSWGSASFFGSPVNLGASAALGWVNIFYNIVDVDSGNNLFHYGRKIWSGSDIVIPYTYTWDVDSNVPTGTMYIPEGKEVRFVAGIETVCTSSVVLVDVASGWIRANGKANHINIDQGTPTTPLLRIDPNPPSYDFQNSLRNKLLNWTFNIWNGGINTLTWTISDNKNWITVTPTSGSSTGDVVPIKVQVDTTGLSLGHHTGEITIDSNMENKVGVIEVEIVNAPPKKPSEPSGPSSGDRYTSYDYSTSTIDPEGDQVYYKFDWGNGQSNWLGPYNSGETCEASKSWTYAGIYEVKVKAKDSYGDEGEWSDIKTVTIGQGIPTLDYSVMCNYVDGGPGPAKTVFDIHEDIFFYGEISNMSEGDMLRVDWKKLSSDTVVYSSNFDPLTWSGDGAMWCSFYPSVADNYRCYVYNNNNFMGLGPVFTVTGEIEIYLNEGITCEWVNGWQDHGPKVTEFQLGEEVTFYLEWGPTTFDFRGSTVKYVWHYNNEEWEHEYLIPLDDPDQWRGVWWSNSWEAPQGTGYIEAYWNDVYLGKTNEYTVVNLATPTVETLAAESVSSNSATLKARIIEDGDRTCQGRFRYKAISDSSWVTTDWKGSLSDDDVFSKSISGLDPDKEYGFQAQAKNEIGESEWGEELHFTTNQNNPPEIPSVPTGRSAGRPSGTYDFSTSSTDPDGDQVYYHWKFNDIMFTRQGPYNSGETATMSLVVPSTLGTYEVVVRAEDAHGDFSEYSGPMTFIVSNPPNKPLLNGPSEGIGGESYTYSAKSTEPDGEKVSYYFDWGDGKNSGWTSFVASGTETSKSHTWNRGSFTVKVKARDENGVESDWETIDITMPKNKATLRLLLLDILEKFINKLPIFERILQSLLQL